MSNQVGNPEDRFSHNEAHIIEDENNKDPDWTVGVQDVLLPNLSDHALLSIMKTSPCNEYPITPHFCIVKLGCTGVYIFFLIFTLKHRLWVLIRTASMRRF